MRRTVRDMQGKLEYAFLFLVCIKKARLITYSVMVEGACCFPHMICLASKTSQPFVVALLIFKSL